MDDIDELDSSELIRNMSVDAVDANDNKLVPTLKDWDRLDKEFEKSRKLLRRIIDDYDKGRSDSDDGITTPIIPDIPKPPLNLGGYRKLEDEEGNKSI